MNEQPSWYFPPRGWGLDVIQDSSSTHFRDDPIPKLVREVLQNSLDANDKDLVGPVEVEISESYVDGRTIGAEEAEESPRFVPGEGERGGQEKRTSFLRQSSARHSNPKKSGAFRSWTLGPWDS